MRFNGLFASLILFIYTASSNATLEEAILVPKPPTTVENCETKLKPPRFNEFGSDQTVVIDTNILVNDPDSFEHFGKAKVIIPMTVLDELNKFKNDEQATSRARGARQFYRTFYEIMAQHPDKLDYPTRDGGTVSIEMGGKISDELKSQLHEETNDARIIQSAFSRMKEKKPVLFVTQDVDAFAKAKTLGIATSKYINPFLNIEDESAYSGVSVVEYEQNFIDQYVASGEVDLPVDTKVQENQFIVMKVTGSEISDRNDFPANQVGRVRIIRDENDKITRIQLKKLVDLDEINFPIRPRNLEQHMFIDLLCDDSIPLKTAVGQAGSGKTLIMLAWAVWKVLTQQPGSAPLKIFITRPSVEMGQRLGFLPGDKDDKMGPYLDPFQDNLEVLANIMNERNWHPLSDLRHKSIDPTPKIEINPVELFPKSFFSLKESDQKQWLKAQRAKGNDLFTEYNRIVNKEKRNQTKGMNRSQRRWSERNEKADPEVFKRLDSEKSRKAFWSPEKLMKEARIENLALQFIRGRSLSNTIVLADEMQNDTAHVAKSLGTRVADGSYMVMTGDPNQVDAPFLDKYSNGLSIMIDRMMSSAASGHITLLQNERGFLSREITKKFGDSEE